MQIMSLFYISPALTGFLLSIWPPFWFTGISFTGISDNYRYVKVVMKLRFYNKNVIGIQYGGNLFSMVDPCYMMLLMANLGRGYNIIDQSANIHFIKPGVSAVHAYCELTQKDIDDIIHNTSAGNKYLKTFTINILDDAEDVVATVERVVYIRKKA